MIVEKASFSPSHCWALYFLTLETDQKRAGGKGSPPKSFSRTVLLPPSGQAICEDQIITEMQQLLNTVPAESAEPWQKHANVFGVVTLCSFKMQLNRTNTVRKWTRFYICIQKLGGRSFHHIINFI